MDLVIKGFDSPVIVETIPPVLIYVSPSLFSNDRKSKVALLFDKDVKVLVREGEDIYEAGNDPRPFTVETSCAEEI